MSLTWTLLIAAAGAIVAVSLYARRRAVPDAPPRQARRTFTPASNATDEAPRTPHTPHTPAARPVVHALPSTLVGWDFVDADDLSPARRDAIVAMFANVPRPPKLLARLISSDLVQKASAAELSDLIGTEPVIAARVLAAVNAPAYGLSRPVTGVTQAVTVLGVRAVRSLCLRYVLQETFRTDTPERSQLLHATWQSSALASELCQQPMQRLALAEGGGTDAAVVLGFLGRLAIAAAIPRGLLDRIPPRDFVRRVVAEQATLGLTATQIGRLLMRQWKLPPDIADAPAAIDRTVLRFWTPERSVADVHHAFGYVCARLGEQIAHGERPASEPFDLARADGDEWACARSYLADARFAALLAQWHEPEVLERIDALHRSMQA